MLERKREEIPGIGIAIWFGFLAVVIPLFPGYMGWTSSIARVGSFVTAAVAFFIGLGGAAIEMRRMGFFEGRSFENLGFAIGFAVVGAAIAYPAASVSAEWLSIGLKLVVVLVGLLALLFLAVALGQFLEQQRRKRESGQETATSRTKAIGATAVVLVTLLTALVNLVTRVLEYVGATN